MSSASFELIAKEFSKKYLLKFPYILDMHLPTHPIFIPKEILPVEDLKLYQKSIEPYDLHPLLKKFIEPYFRELHENFIMSGAYNGLLTRYESFDARTKTIFTRPVFYFDHWLVHYHAYDDIAPDKSIYELFGDRLVYELENPKEASIFPSGMGFDAILLTKDGYLLIPQRSAQVMIEKRKFAPSVSGGLKWRFFPSEHMKGYYAQIKDELMEEYGIPVTPGDRFIVTGIEKNLPYFGHPNVYVFGILNATSTNLISFKNFEHSIVGTVKIVSNPDFTKEKLRETYKALLDVLRSFKKNEIAYQLAASVYYFGEFIKTL